jgi:NAD(P)-dependent dehydrogenase (short-subunit alcohol dehydrogenase family)
MSSWKYAAPKSAYISGGGSGIGLNIVKALIAEGTDIAIFDLKVDEAVLSELKQLCISKDQKIQSYLVDITDHLAVEAAMAKAATDIGTPDFGFNSAGILRTALFSEISYETFDLVVKINLMGSRNFAAGILPHMKSGGHLVLVASLAGIVGSYTQAAYAASKFGVVGLAEVLRTELKTQNIDVSVVCPGEIDTPLLQHERLHGSPITKALNEIAGVMSVEDAIAGILKGIRKREYMITPGFHGKLIRFLARKTTGLFHRIVDKTLAKAIAEDQQKRAGNN